MGYDNPIPSLAGATLSASNGRCAPEVVAQSASGSNVDEATDGVFQLVATPVVAGTLVVSLSTERFAVRSPEVRVEPAPLHWETCAVKTAVDRVNAGHELAALLLLRDQFENPVVAEGTRFEAVLEYSDDADSSTSEAPVVFEGHRSTLTAQLTPSRKGKLRVRVQQNDATAAPLYSNTVICE